MPLPALVVLALLGFSANSLLTRAALAPGLLDPMHFMAIRIVSGAAVLWVVMALRRGARTGRGSLKMALMLSAYAVAFTLAYTRITAATGALLLFGAVHLTMAASGLRHRESLTRRQLIGNGVAVSGLLVLTVPAWQAPDPLGALLMVQAGVSWGVYSLEGRRRADPTATTADNFALAGLICVPVGWFGHTGGEPTAAGVALAVASGGLASGLAYAVWYAALPRLAAWRAALVQLAVPVVTAVAASGLLAEPIGARVALAAGLVIGGIALTLTRP